MKAGKDMTKQEKLDFLSNYKLPVDPKTMTDAQLSGAVNMMLLSKVMKG